MDVNAMEPAPVLSAAAAAAWGDPRRPLFISDADEVLLRFVAGLERFLEAEGLWLDLSSYALHGNVKRTGTDERIPDSEVSALLQRFWIERIGRLDAVPGAAEALAGLSARADILILTNVPAERGPERAHNLARLGMPYPVVPNAGLKGPAIRTIAALRTGPVLFVDDIPHNLASARQDLPSVRCAHFVADPRLRPLLGPARDAEAHPEDWDAIAAWAHQALDSHGR